MVVEEEPGDVRELTLVEPVAESAHSHSPDRGKPLEQSHPVSKLSNDVVGVSTARQRIVDVVPDELIDTLISRRLDPNRTTGGERSVKLGWDLAIPEPASLPLSEGDRSGQLPQRGGELGLEAFLGDRLKPDRAEHRRSVLCDALQVEHALWAPAGDFPENPSLADPGQPVEHDRRGDFDLAELTSDVPTKRAVPALQSLDIVTARSKQIDHGARSQAASGAQDDSPPHTIGARDLSKIERREERLGESLDPPLDPLFSPRLRRMLAGLPKERSDDRPFAVIEERNRPRSGHVVLRKFGRRTDVDQPDLGADRDPIREQLVKRDLRHCFQVDHERSITGFESGMESGPRPVSRVCATSISVRCSPHGRCARRRRRNRVDHRS